jgi:AcrR family transcriptional regulator
MRVRTDEKRQEIVKVAAELFEQYGFDRTSMSMISDRLGGSKATLYGYFQSKDDLFKAVVEFDIPAQSEKLMAEFFSGKDLKESFTKLGIAFLTRLLSPTPIANMRMMANRPEGSEISRTFYKQTLRPAWERLAFRIKVLMDEGQLRKADPWVATMHWKGLNEGDLLDRRLLGIDKEIAPSEILAAAKAAADAFLTLYGPDKAPAKPKAKAKK